MIYKGLGTGSIIERNKARINYVIELSNDTESVSKLVNSLLNNLIQENLLESLKVLNELFYENIEIDNIKTIMGEIIKIDNIDELKKNIIEACIIKPRKGFVWNCYYKIMYFTI